MNIVRNYYWSRAMKEIQTRYRVVIPSNLGHLRRCRLTRQERASLKSCKQTDNAICKKEDCTSKHRRMPPKMASSNADGAWPNYMRCKMKEVHGSGHNTNPGTRLPRRLWEYLDSKSVSRCVIIPRRALIPSRWL